MVCCGSTRGSRELAGATGLEPAASCVAGRRTALGESPASRKSENHRINTGDLWWAWVDLNHRPRPYQDSVVRSYKDLQVPRGLPKTAQVLQDHSNCGFNCGLKTSVFVRLRPGADCPHMAFGLAHASSHSPRDGVWLGTRWPAGLGLVRVVNPWFF